MSTRLESGFQEYRRKVIPESASPVQVNETRNGFYAGAWHLFSTIMTTLEPGTEETDADVRMIDELHAEFTAFLNSKRS